jgi:hypothetical protein
MKLVYKDPLDKIDSILLESKGSPFLLKFKKTGKMYSCPSGMK